MFQIDINCPAEINIDYPADHFLSKIKMKQTKIERTFRTYNKAHEKSLFIKQPRCLSVYYMQGFHI